jgi:two-component system phosphate regulon response regulator PhoB
MFCQYKGSMAEFILIIEDEPDIASTLAYNLEKQGFRTRIEGTGQGGLTRAQGSPTPDLILLDLMLPDISGHDVCERLRSQRRTRSVPIIMLTARGEEEDRVTGFERGADDYVTKPFSVRELIARIRAVLRRVQNDAGEGSVSLRAGVIRVDVDGHRIWVDGEEIELTAIEYRLLNTFVERQGRVQSREQLIDAVWGLGTAITFRTVDVHVKRLRGKLGTEASAYIDTVWGVGYRLVVPDGGS